MTAGNLVLSLFPGIGMLDSAFEEEGFCVVRGPDVLWGGDIRRFHPPADVFGGVIGGPPCQCFSSMRHLVAARGYKPRYGNLIPEFERCVAEAQPTWFLMENVRQAPAPNVPGYGVHCFVLDNRQLGATQSRKRRISFGWFGPRRPLLIDTVALETREFEYAAIGGDDSIDAFNRRKKFRSGVMRRPGYSRKGVERLKRLQGLPADFTIPAFTVEAMSRAISNGVPLSMGRALARAVREAISNP